VKFFIKIGDKKPGQVINKRNRAEEEKYVFVLTALKKHTTFKALA